MKNKLILVSLLLISQISAQNVALFTLPKTGTNLVLKLLKIVLNEQKNSNISALNRTIYWGHEWNYQTELGTLEPNHNKIKKMKEINAKLILLLRDPRQHVIALLRTLRKPINHSTIDWGVQHFPEMIAIVTGRNNCFLRYKDINECYHYYLQWAIQYPYTFVTSFEKLVGPRGGGEATKQHEEIKKIIEFLEIDLNDAEITELATRLFGETHTFKEGQIDSWKKYYSNENKALFKQVAGQLLIDLGYEKDFDW